MAQLVRAPAHRSGDPGWNPGPAENFSLKLLTFHLAYMLLPVPKESWIAIKMTLPQCGGDTSSCTGPYPTAACSQCHIGSLKDRELFNLSSYYCSKVNIYERNFFLFIYFIFRFNFHGH